MLTITEALAEIKTINKRLESKRASVLQYLGRQEGIKDPLEKDVEGGSAEFVKRERQAIFDLEERVVTIRRGVGKANQTTTITVGDVATRSIEDWLVWRREVAGGQRQFLTSIRNGFNKIRSEAHRVHANVVAVGQMTEQAADWIINISESEIAKESEDLEMILGTLDGLLSLKNATTTIEE